MGEPALDLDPAPHWRRLAACRGEDTEIFFPARGETTRPARSVCELCPVRAPCLEHGLYEKFGIWGGKSERERRRMRRLLGIRLADADDDPTEDEDDQMEDDDEWQ